MLATACRYANRMKPIVCILLLMTLFFSLLSLPQACANLPSDKISDMGIGREFIIGSPMPDSYTSYVRALNFVEKLNREKTDAQYLLCVCKSESLGAAHIVLRDVLQVSQVRFHSQLYLVPFCGHAPPSGSL